MPVKENLGGAHGGPASLGRQHTLTVLGQKQGVDQFRLAPGILANKGNGQFVLNQQFDTALQVVRQIG